MNGHGSTCIMLPDGSMYIHDGSMSSMPPDGVMYGQGNIACDAIPFWCQWEDGESCAHAGPIWKTGQIFKPVYVCARICVDGIRHAVLGACKQWPLPFCHTYVCSLLRGWESPGSVKEIG
jgi:hypothetical protein